MIYYTMKRQNGDIAKIRSCGRFKYALDVCTRAGRNDNANWPETFYRLKDAKNFAEEHGFVEIEIV